VTTQWPACDAAWLLPATYMCVCHVLFLYMVYINLFGFPAGFYKIEYHRYMVICFLNMFSFIYGYMCLYMDSRGLME